MSARRARVFAAALSGTLSVAVLAAACGSEQPTRPAHHSSPHTSAPRVTTLSAVLTADQRKLVLGVVRTTARANRPRPHSTSRSRVWSSDVDRVVAAVGSLSDADAWKKPGTDWPLSDRREAAAPVLIVQMFGRFRFFRLRTPSTGGPPVVAKYDVPELTYVISTLDGARLSVVRGYAPPNVTPAQTIFAR